MKWMITTLIAAVLAMPTAGPVSAQDKIELSAPEAARKINLAGRQRMLSQRMAKAACLMAQDIGFSSHYDQLTQAYNLFARTAHGLALGDVDLGLVEEQIPEVLEALKAVEGPWEGYRAIVEEAIDTGEIEDGRLAELDSGSLDVLKRMNIAVFKSARAYADVLGDISLGLAITIDVAGRQRMLTQKAVKDACLMSAATEPEIYAGRVAETKELFSLSLEALRDGYEDVGVIAAPSREIDRKLSEVVELWEPVEQILDKASEGEILDKRELSALARLSEPLMQTMNEAVGMYER